VTRSTLAGVRLPFHKQTLDAILGLATEMLFEIYPLWLLLRVSLGGFSYSSTGIGTILMISAPLQFFGQAMVYPRIVKRFGLMRTYRSTTLWVATTAAAMPFFSLLTGADMMLATDGTTGWVSFVGALVSWLLVAGFWQWSFIGSFVFLNNSCYSHQKAAANGLAQAAVAATRVVGPMVAANIFALTASNSYSWPLDFRFAFLLAGFFYATAAATTLLFRLDVTKRKLLPHEEEHAETT